MDNEYEEAVAFIPECIAPEAIKQEGTYLLGDRREFCVPTSSSTARLAVLNTLRTISPALLQLRLTDVAEAQGQNLGSLECCLILYDWYYKSNDLHMLVLELHCATDGASPTPNRLHDAFALREDLLHVFVAKGALRKTDTSSKGFGGFYIKSATTDEWLPLVKALSSAVKTCKFNTCLQDFLANKERGMLAQCRNPVPPSTWQPFPSSMCFLLLSAPRLCCLDAEGTCPERSCVCHEVKTMNDALQKIPSSVDQALQTHVEKTVRALQSLQRLEPQASVQRPERHSYDAKGERRRCLLCKSCPEPATCYFVECCSHNEPVACLAHVEHELRSSNLGIVRCPKHQISGECAHLLR